MNVEDFVIQFKNIIEFDFLEYNFAIQYNQEDKTWIVRSLDEEKYPDDLILEDFEDDSIELFEEYFLTKKEFKEMKDIVKLELNNKKEKTYK